MFRYGDRRSTGIHVGDGGLQVVELCQRGRAVALEHAVRLNIHELPSPLPWLDPKLQHEVADTLRRARREHGIRFRRPYFALDERSAIVKRRVLLPSALHDNRENLEWEARQFLSDEIKAYAIDYLLTTDFGFVVAARRAAMDRLTGICQHAGIPKPQFDLALFALYNTLEASAGLLSSGSELLLDVGACTARSILLAEGQLRAVGTIRARRMTTLFPNGSNRAGPALDAAADADRAAASAPNGTHDTDEPPSLSEFDEWMRTLARGVEKLLRTEMGGMYVDRCWLSGQHAAQSQDSLSRRLGFAVQLLDPFSGIAVRTQDFDDSPVFATAAGLALRGIAEA